MPASHSTLPTGWWQEAHEPSGWAPATWFTPVVKFTSLWQEPQAAIEGFVYQLDPPAAVLSWQDSQLRMSCGYVMPGTTSSSSPAWMRCQKSWPLYRPRSSAGSPPVAGIVSLMLFGLWHIVHVLRSR